MNAAKAHNTDRRGFLGTAATIAGGSILGAASPLPQAAEPTDDADKAVKMLYDALTDAQRKVMCFDWDKKGSPLNIGHLDVS